MGNVTVTYYAERMNGKIKYFKKNTDRFGQLISRIEIEKWEYEWGMEHR